MCEGHILPSEGCWDYREILRARSIISTLYLRSQQSCWAGFSALAPNSSVAQQGIYRHHSLASGPPMAFTGINFGWCRQCTGCFSPAAVYYPIFLACLSPIFGCHSIIIKKIPVCLWAARKGLLIFTFFCCFQCIKILSVMLELLEEKRDFLQWDKARIERYFKAELV